VANVIKENEKTLIFNGLDEGEVLVMQPLINVLEGTLVEIMGDDRDPSAGGKGDKAARVKREEGPDGKTVAATGQKRENATRKKPAERGEKAAEKK
jgi:hypothetical protein